MLLVGFDALALLLLQTFDARLGLSPLFIDCLLLRLELLFQAFDRFAPLALHALNGLLLGGEISVEGLDVSLGVVLLANKAFNERLFALDLLDLTLLRGIGRFDLLLLETFDARLLLGEFFLLATRLLFSASSSSSS